ncbi:hypothetical protein ACNYS0_21135 [Streptomyces sp. BH034]|uniref:hypothetical protein n=1 Tax=Streptomyces sp. BH034 TaxID=3402626 RepID=UPI003BB49D38
MTAVIAVGGTALWLLAFVFYLGAPRRPIVRPPSPWGPSDYDEGAERLRASIAGAYRETTPGPPSQDLITCWSIWSDPPGGDDVQDDDPD